MIIGNHRYHPLGCISMNMWSELYIIVLLAPSWIVSPIDFILHQFIMYLTTLYNYESRIGCFQIMSVEYYSEDCCFSVNMSCSSHQKLDSIILASYASWYHNCNLLNSLEYLQTLTWVWKYWLQYVLQQMVAIFWPWSSVLNLMKFESLWFSK